MNGYNFSELERKWQNHWNETGAYRTVTDTSKPKCYVLDMFPYPSGAGLHVGHPLGYIATDIYSRYKRLKGFNVLHPMGFDSFGLPAEQYALETGQHPADTTEKNIRRYKEQLNAIGFCYDWQREVRTSDPGYYRWTQWIFLQLYQSWFNPDSGKAEPISTLKNHLDPSLTGADLEAEIMNYRLAYRAESYVNWCEALGTVLANDEVVNGVSERGGHPVERKKMNQWFLRITAYAERLLKDLDKVDYPESLKEMQRNWIGRSEGAELRFQVDGKQEFLEIFTTRPDTLFGVSFMVLAPEHPLIQVITTPDYEKSVRDYQQQAASRSERERMAETKKVSGVFTGSFAIHPLTMERIPIWIADYVLMGYGTGAIMAVPAGDSRDHAFARQFNLPVPAIFKDRDITDSAVEDKQVIYDNSSFLNGLNYQQALTRILSEIEEKKLGTRKVNYRMRDAGFSRQRYWGEPFPIIYNESGQSIPMNEDSLPLELPHLPNYQPGPNGQGPLANATSWLQVSDPSHGNCLRETDTMPGYAGSSWYYLRYMDPNNETSFCDRNISDYWNQVDVYMGGAEHAVGHLLYSRMWCKVLFDLGHIGFEEPYKKLINQGMIQGSSRFVYRVQGTNQFVSANLKNDYETHEIHVDVSLCDGLFLDIEKFRQWRSDYQNATFILEGDQYICGSLTEKMSKSKFNVVNPDDIIASYGTDTFRMYEMFLGPIDVSKPWDTKGIEGVHRFLKKFWRLFVDEEAGYKVNQENGTPEEFKILHQTIKKVAHDIENFAFNTAISQFMICTNELSRLQCSKKEILIPLLIILTPFAPHICAELWDRCQQTGSILDASFPAVEEKWLVENTFRYPIAINGKTRFEYEFALDANEQDIQSALFSAEMAKPWLEGKTLKKMIFVKGRMINLVIDN